MDHTLILTSSLWTGLGRSLHPAAGDCDKGVSPTHMGWERGLTAEPYLVSSRSGVGGGWELHRQSDKLPSCQTTCHRSQVPGDGPHTEKKHSMLNLALKIVQSQLSCIVKALRSPAGKRPLYICLTQHFLKCFEHRYFLCVLLFSIIEKIIKLKIQMG